jgi:hypothetical protein
VNLPCSLIEGGTLARVAARGKANLTRPAKLPNLTRPDVSQHSVSDPDLSGRENGHLDVVGYALRFRLDLTALDNMIWYVREHRLGR